jgi:hypothetical protein
MPEPIDHRTKVLYVGTDHAAALFGPVLIVIVQNDPQPGVLQQQAGWVQQMQARAPQGSGYLVLLRTDVPPPPETARALIRRLFQEFGKVARAGAMVVEGQGFAGSALRSVLTMLILAARPGYPLKVFSTVSEACDWLASQLAATVDAVELSHQVESVRAAYTAGALRAAP